VKLQEAYFSESNAIGSWTMIGYKAPAAQSAADSISTTGTNFNYSQQGTYTAGTMTTASATALWQAKNSVVLNDCAVDNNNVWQIKGTISSAIVTFQGSVSNACKPLTPTFDKIGK
jgi:hypothetical protein